VESTINQVVSRRFVKKQQMQWTLRGHVLRHSLATQMVVGGGTFKEIADVLGHQSLATTEIYAKLDLGSLSQVAMPWPGGNSNE
jgi:integrase/recombinase XerD